MYIYAKILECCKKSCKMTVKFLQEILQNLLVWYERKLCEAGEWEDKFDNLDFWC